MNRPDELMLGRFFFLTKNPPQGVIYPVKSLPTMGSFSEFLLYLTHPHIYNSIDRRWLEKEYPQYSISQYRISQPKILEEDHV
jgi:hypothetical protein